jgi:FG-GAP-like repeat/FG-GAP repeat
MSNKKRVSKIQMHRGGLASLLAVALLFVLRPPCAGAMHFVETQYPVGNWPMGVTIGDFNRDGNPDLVVANYDSSTLSVLLGNGNGTFHSAVNYAVGASPSSVVVRDFNGDHIPDLAVACLGSSSVSILLGRGDGTFLSAIGYPAGDNIFSVDAGDLNGDGKLDLVVTNSAGVATLLGNGNGSFQRPIVTTYGHSTVRVAAADFSNDHVLDIAGKSGGSDTELSVLLGHGNDTFHLTWSDNPVLSIPTFVVGDFNQDGKLDLAALYNTPIGFGIRRIRVLLGNGDGTFRYGWNQTILLPLFIAGGDFNNDHRLDLALLGRGGQVTSNFLYILLGNGDGTFQNKLTFSLTTIPSSMVSADLNHDGRGDVVLTNSQANTISVLLNFP